MSGSRVKESAPHRLIVEGRDDQWAIIALTAKHGWDWERPGPHYPYIHNAEGVEPALEALKVTILSYSRVGVVLDADLAPDNRWQAVRDRLSDTGFSLPSQPNPTRWVPSWKTREVGWGFGLCPTITNPESSKTFSPCSFLQTTGVGPGLRRAQRRPNGGAPHFPHRTSSRRAFTLGLLGKGSRANHSAPLSMRPRSPMTATRRDYF